MRLHGGMPGAAPGKKVRWFEDRHGVCVTLLSSYRGLLSLQHRTPSHFSVPFVPRPPTSQGDTRDKLRQPSAPTLLPPWITPHTHTQPLPWKRITQGSEQNGEFPRGKPHGSLEQVLRVAKQGLFPLSSSNSHET